VPAGRTASGKALIEQIRLGAAADAAGGRGRLALINAASSSSSSSEGRGTGRPQATLYSLF